MPNSSARFLKGKFFWILTAALAFQGALFYLAAGTEQTPLARPLRLFPTQLAQWHLYQDSPVEKETLDVLRADDTLNRIYLGPGGTYASLFIAYFKTQRTGQTPHSPQNCLPGSGWVPSRIGSIQVDIPGRAKPIQINQYVVAKGDDKSVVLYWYQSRERVIASEFAAKIWLVADAVRYHRSDTALVRIVVPVGQASEAAATATAVDFVRTSFPLLRGFLPS